MPDLEIHTVVSQFCWSGKSAIQPRMKRFGVVVGLFSIALYAVRSTGSSAMSTARFCFHCETTHSTRVFAAALDEYVNLRPLRASFAVWLALLKASFAAATSYFCVLSV